jgi:two-component system LytT family sensor kinase
MMTVSKKKGLKDKWARIIGIPIIVVFLIAYGSLSASTLSFRVLIVPVIKDLVYVTIYWECSRFIFLYLRNKYPSLRETAKRIGLQSLICLLFIFIAGLLVAMVNYYFPDRAPEPFFAEYKDVVGKSLLLIGIVTVTYECTYFFARWEHSLYESERLKKESMISQFELLKNQVSPHFLFNSLNALITLVPEDPKLAVLFIQRLSNVYRHALNNNEKNTVYLETELQFLGDYIFLNQMRFGENLQIHYDLPEDLIQFKVIPFALQMLVENAIKHNIISNKKPLTITVSKLGNHIVVNNNLQKKTSGVESTYTGLQNIINRYQLLTDQLVEVKATETSFSVSLPLIFDNDIYEGTNY